jgi:hypothetical protein
MRKGHRFRLIGVDRVSGRYNAGTAARRSDDRAQGHLSEAAEPQRRGRAGERVPDTKQGRSSNMNGPAQRSALLLFE